MLLEPILFYFFAAALLLSALLVISLKNTVHSALALVLAFVFSASLWMMLQAEFLALILILVYVGAVMTLFLFVVMTINLDNEPKQMSLVRYFPIAILLMLVLAGFMIHVLNNSHDGLNNSQALYQHASNYSNTKALGAVLYTQYVYPFELAAVILLVAIIAAISLNPREPRERKSQSIADQTRVQAKDRLHILKMPVDKKQ